MKNFDFIAKKKIFYIVTVVLLVAGLVSFFVRGFNIDIDFAGGTEASLDIGKEVTADERDAIKDLVLENLDDKSKYSSVEKSAADGNMVIIKTNQLTTDEKAKILSALTQRYGLDVKDFDSYESQSATLGKETTATAIKTSVIAIVLMLVYITFRFQFTSGLASVCCLIFNLFAMFTLYSLFQIPLNSNVIAACLTILGYSINATIVIFDRIRENLKSDKNFGKVANDGVHQTFWRSINTTVTTLLTIGMIYIFGVEAIRNFALPLIVGIVAGLFSSVCLAAPLWGDFRKLFKVDAKKD